MEEFKYLLTVIANVLKNEGFKKKGFTFFSSDEGNWGLIDFQKSKDSERGKIKFTINLGIRSATIAQALQSIRGDQISIETCHWSKRIGFLLPENRDHWWEIGDDRNKTTSIIQEISGILKEIAVLDLKKHIKDESLIEEWLTGQSEGATELQRYIYLTILLKSSNDKRLPEVVENFKQFYKGKSFEYTAVEHLKELKLYE